MAKYENEELGLSFTVPDQVKVRRQLRYRAALAGTADLYSRYWLAMLEVVDDWQCEAIPDPAQLDVDEETSKRITDIVVWATNTVAGHMSELEDVPGNS